jgi:hypothetical protein
MSRPRQRPHPRLHLPPLDPHEALLLVAICERIIAAVWRAHGEDMADVMANDLSSEPAKAIHTDLPVTNDDPLF